MAVILALCCAAAYGAADFLGGMASRRAPAYAVVIWSQAAGLALVVAVLPWLGGSPRAADLAWGVGVGSFGALAVIALYRGLAVGTMSVVSPVTAVLAAALPVMFAGVRGERPSGLALGGIACALAAVVLVSAVPVEGPAAVRAAPRRHPLRLAPGIAEALVAGTAFGCFFIGLAQTQRTAGVLPLAVARVVSLVLLGSWIAIRRAPVAIPRGARTTVAWCGLLDMSANVFFVLAAGRGPLAVVAVLSSLYPASTVALAAIVVRERLAASQWAGVALALAGVVALAAS